MENPFQADEVKEKIKEKKLEEPSFLKERIINIESLIPSEIINEISEITLNNNILDFVINYYANNPSTVQNFIMKFSY